MQTVFVFVIALIAFICLILIHEFGHFLAAKCFRVRVIRFSIGFGKPLWRAIDRQGTEYAVSPILLGGYVKLLDETEGCVAAKDLPYTFNRQAPWKKIIIILSGPLANLLLAVILWWCVFMWGVVGIRPIVGHVLPNSIAARAGMSAPAEIIAVNDHRTPTWENFRLRLIPFLGRERDFVISARSLKTKQEKRYHFKSVLLMLSEKSDLITTLGFVPNVPKIPPIVQEVTPGGPADFSGLQAGDIILKVNQKPVDDFVQVFSVLTQSPGRKVTLLIRRQNTQKVIMLIPDPVPQSDGSVTGHVGIKSRPMVWPAAFLYKRQYAILPAFVAAVHEAIWIGELSIVVMYKMLIGEISWHYLGGPITIFQGLSFSASSGLISFLSFLAFLNIGLGLINLLPIPVLDGGYLMYYVIEWIKQKPLSLRFQRIGNKIGLWFLLGLITIAFLNDLMRLF